MTSDSIDVTPAGNSIVIEPGSYKFDLPWPVAETIVLGDMVVVRVEPPAGTVFNENVFGISCSGHLLWQIKALKHVYEDSPYTSIKETKAGLKLSNWDGDDLIVDPKSGTILQVAYSK